MEEKQKSETENIHTPVWEWILAALGTVLVGVAISMMVYRATTLIETPPSFETSVESISPTSNGFVVAFRVKNTGSQTAAGVNIEANLEQSGQTVESSTATLTYVPGRSERHGGVFFTKDPGAHTVSIRALGYEKP